MIFRLHLEIPMALLLKALRLEDAPAVSIPGRLPIWWTPEIKALWLPLRLAQEEVADDLWDLNVIYTWYIYIYICDMTIMIQDI